MSLFDEINQKCTAQEIADGNYHVIAAKVSANRKLIKERRISEIEVLNEYPGGPVVADSILVKLEAYANSSGTYSGVMKRAFKSFYTSEGINFGAPHVQQILTQLVSENVITMDESTNLKNMALIDSPVSWEECQAAIEKGN